MCMECQEAYMKNRLKTFFSLLIIAILCIISVVCLTACLDTNTKTDKESDTETNPICETLMYGSGRYVSAGKMIQLVVDFIILI